ncbi:uncharacterized protein [Eschrichtius robustus]|uniref:uncharacterized protein n=1 Tax=Eschrichtius robustus TaxID=9764 RepID=UPI0035BF680A
MVPLPLVTAPPPPPGPPPHSHSPGGQEPTPHPPPPVSPRDTLTAPRVLNQPTGLSSVRPVLLAEGWWPPLPSIRTPTKLPSPRVRGGEPGLTSPGPVSLTPAPDLHPHSCSGTHRGHRATAVSEAPQSPPPPPHTVGSGRHWRQVSAGQPGRALWPLVVCMYPCPRSPHARAPPGKEQRPVDLRVPGPWDESPRTPEPAVKKNHFGNKPGRGPDPHERGGSPRGAPSPSRGRRAAGLDQQTLAVPGGDRGFTLPAGLQTPPGAQPGAQTAGRRHLWSPSSASSSRCGPPAVPRWA